MRRRTRIGLGLAAVALLVAPFVWLHVEPPVALAPVGAGSRGAAVASAAPAAGTDASAPATADGRARAAAPEPAPAAAAQVAGAAGEWTVQLTGIDPALPWTAPLRLVFDRRLELEVAVDARGAARFVPPPIVRQPSVHQVAVLAVDDHYRIVRPRRDTADLQQAGRLDVAVHPIARFRGRVLGPDGLPFAARVSAFALGPLGPHEPAIARGDADHDGRYELRAPSATPLLLLAEAVAAATPLPLLAAPEPSVLFAHLHTTTVDDVGPDPRLVRTDLLPAALRSEGVHGTVRTVPDLRLASPALLRGRVVTGAGAPVAHADVVAAPLGANPAAWRGAWHWSPANGVVAGARARADAAGAFVLPLPAGAPVVVRASVRGMAWVAGEPRAEATAPGHLELVAPGAVVELRVVDAGRPVAGASLHVDDVVARADDAGRLRVTLPPAGARVHARADVRSSPPLALRPQPGADAAVVVLELATPPLADVRLDLRGDIPFLAARFAWQPANGDPPFELIAERATAESPFVLRVPSGRHRLTMTGLDHEPGGICILPLQLDLDVAPSGAAATHAVPFGGRVELDVQDRNGARPPGVFVLRDAGGHDVTPRAYVFAGDGARRSAAPGVLQPGELNHLAAPLPAGDYTLTVDVAGHTSARRVLSVRALSTSRVALALR